MNSSFVGVPESPRWLMLHARIEECEIVSAEVERRVRAAPGVEWLTAVTSPVRLVVSTRTPVKAEQSAEDEHYSNRCEYDAVGTLIASAVPSFTLFAGNERDSKRTVDAVQLARRIDGANRYRSPGTRAGCHLPNLRTSSTIVSFRTGLIFLADHVLHLPLERTGRQPGLQ